MTTPALEGLKSVLEFGSDSEVSTYIQTHWKELPPKLQDHLTVGVLIDAVDEHVRQNEEFDNLRIAFLETLEEIDKLAAEQPAEPGAN